MHGVLHSLNGRRKKLMAAAVAAVAIASAAGIFVTQFVEHPQLNVFPGSALAGNTVKIFLGLPPATPMSTFKLYSINYGDGNTTHSINSEHVYSRPGIYTVTATYAWNGQRGESTTHVYVHPSSFTAEPVRLGDTAAYAIHGTLTVYNPFGIATIPFNMSGVNSTLTVDSLFMRLSGNASYAVENGIVTVHDGLGVPHETYVIDADSNMTGKGYVKGTAAGLPVNFTVIVTTGYDAKTFNSINGNYTVKQDAGTSTSISLQIGGKLVRLGGGQMLATDAYANLTGGMPWQNEMLSAIGENGSFVMTASQMSKYSRGFTGDVEMGLNGSYHGFRWSAALFDPSLINPAINVNITSGSSFSEQLKLDSLSAFPLFTNNTFRSVHSGTTVISSSDAARTSVSNGSVPAAAGGVYWREQDRGQYTRWNGSALPMIGTTDGILNITKAYDFALNGTSLGAYIRTAAGARMVSAEYNFTRSSWYMQFGNATGKGYAVTVTSSNGTMTARGLNDTVNMSGVSAFGTNVLTLASAMQIVNGSSPGRYFFSSSGTPEMSSISISSAPYLPQTSVFLPLPPSSTAFAYTFTSATGQTVAVDGTNGQIMFFESGTSFSLL